MKNMRITGYSYTCEITDPETDKPVIDKSGQCQAGSTKETTEKNGEWIKWSGGCCPVDPTSMVILCYRYGYINPNPQIAARVNWGHGFYSMEGSNDIVCYQVVK